MRTFRFRWFVALIFALAIKPGSLPAQQAAPGSLISVTSPLNYQVFQRHNRLEGKIEIRGHTQLPGDRMEVRLTGDSASGPLPGNWKRIHFERKSETFRTSLAAPAGGFYRLEIRLMQHGRSAGETAVAHVGIGEVFVIAGQSNSTNYGEVRQTTATGMVTAFDGSGWQIANDPQPGVQDHSSKGSFIPAFGDALYRKYHVPIGVACVGYGSTSVRQWLPAGRRVLAMPTMTKFIKRDPDGELISDGTLFNGMIARMDELGRHGFRAVLWHQGESDANQAPEHQITAPQYRQMMVELIRATRKAAGWKMPWFVAETTYHNPADTGSPAIEQAQRSLWQKGIALEGPNTDALGGAYRQNYGKGVHFNDAGLKAHGMLWAAAVENDLDDAHH
jgi:hypothetical protein